MSKHKTKPFWPPFGGSSEGGASGAPAAPAAPLPRDPLKDFQDHPSPAEWDMMKGAKPGDVIPAPSADAIQRLAAAAAGAYGQGTGIGSAARRAQLGGFVSPTEGVKFDADKLRYDLLPADAIRAVVAVLTYGAAKYADRNWELGMDRARLSAARARHESERALGRAKDDETGMPHLAHEAACALMELALYLRGVGSDSRPDLKATLSPHMLGETEMAMRGAIATVREARSMREARAH